MQRTARRVCVCTGVMRAARILLALCAQADIVVPVFHYLREVYFLTMLSMIFPCTRTT